MYYMTPVLGAFLIFLFSFSSHAKADESCVCQNRLAEVSVDQLLACHSDPRCHNDLADIRVSLQVKSRFLAEAISQYLELSNNPLFSDQEREQFYSRIESDKRRLTAIKSILKIKGYDELIEPLYLDFDAPEKNFHRFYYSFNLGYEYVSLNEIFQKGVPRLGFLLYRRYGPVPALTEGPGYYGLHVMGSLQLTSSAEQGNNADETNVVDNTLEASIELFAPLYHSLLRNDARLTDYLGFMSSFGAKKNENEEHIKSRMYFGLRNALNAETYTDFLLGRSQGVDDLRLEARAHIPVYKFAFGSRIFLGGVINMALPWSADNKDKDVIRFYLEWNANFGKIIEGISSAVGI